MRIFASGEGQKLSAPGEFLTQGSIGRVVGLVDLGQHNGANDFGWSGLKAVIHFDGNDYVLDFPDHTRLETDDGIGLTQSDAGEIASWTPHLSDIERYGLKWIEPISVTASIRRND
ncbi:MAG: hypothetical protein E2582_08855 [Delftia sp.]|uniref:hypothetical protein n=1 Tax=Delftia acidovorans TaxID=80866 RepID=UPI0012D18B6E|nr:hypothetical protein [Delftia sp.]